MVHLPMVDKKITELINNGESYIVGIRRNEVDIYKEIDAFVFPFKLLHSEDKIGFVVKLIDNKYFVDDEDIETIKVVFDVRDSDIDKFKKKTNWILKQITVA